jgi:hypothetical protein
VDYKERVAMLAALRCMDCDKTPTKIDVTQMMEAFGHNLREGDAPNLRWRCLACVKKARKTGS